MTPREQAELLYSSRYRQPRSFWTDYALHRVTGYVIETDTAFLMGRPVWKDAPVEALRNPQVKFHESICDAWLIWIFAGDIREMLHLAPFPLPYVGWSRRHGPIRWYRSEEALERVLRNANYCRDNQAGLGAVSEDIRPGRSRDQVLRGTIQARDGNARSRPLHGEP